MLLPIAPIIRRLKATLRKRPRQRVRAQIETLEDRVLLANVSLIGETLTIQAGRGEQNFLTIQNDGSNLLIEDTAGLIAIAGVTANLDGSISVAAAAVNEIRIDARDGNDRVDLADLSIPAIVRGGSGDDVLIGGKGGDFLLGQSGNDNLHGGKGNDNIRGGTGDDRVWGGMGDDRISGSLGNDILRGGNGDDLIRGGGGNDGVAGDAGDDWAYGNRGSDSVLGGSGDDVLMGGLDADIVMGDSGDDRVSGQRDQDTVAGGSGANTVDGPAAETDEAFTFFMDWMDLELPPPPIVDSGVLGGSQLSAAEVETLLQRADVLSPNNDAIIAVVDRGGHILGIRTESGVQTAEVGKLVFSIDGAVAKARTAAFFSNGDPANGTLAPITSRLVRFISQSTVTEREVDSNPNIVDPQSTLRGPGFVAPIGLGGHFPPGVAFTPHVDLFGIEHTNRDSTLHPGDDGIKGTTDDILLRGRFNANQNFVDAGQAIDAPESYGRVSGLLPYAQSRGIATLPGGVPLFRDTNSDGVGDTLVGGIGVFFPGVNGFATHEQGFVANAGQTEFNRTNAPRVLEAEYIAFAAAGGSLTAAASGAPGAKFGSVVDVNGGSVPAVDGLDMPFGRLDLVGITLEVVGPIAGILGVQQLLQYGSNLGVGAMDDGTDQMVDANGTQHLGGRSVPQGWLVNAHASPDVESLGSNALTADDVTQLIQQAVTEAQRVRAAIRLPLSSRTRMIIAVTDTAGEVLGLFRMQDATVFSLDVAVAKARNVAYFSDANDLEAVDQVPGIAAGVGFTNRTFRYLAEPRFPSGQENTVPPEFSALNTTGINPATAENAGAPITADAFDRAVNPTGNVLGFDAFNPNTNFHDPGDVGVVAAADVFNNGKSTARANQNGVVFFPGSIPIYKNGVLVGGLGISGDGVDQDDTVTFTASAGFRPAAPNLRADQTFYRNVRLPFMKFLRNPYG